MVCVFRSEGIGREVALMVKRYIFHTLPEWFFCIVLLVSLDWNLVQSFDLPQTLCADLPRIILVNIAAVTVLFATGFSKRTLKMGIPLLIAAGVIAILICTQSGVSLLESNDADANEGLFYLVLIVTALIVCPLVRRSEGAVFLGIFGSLANGWFAVLKYPFSDLALVGFLLSVMILYLLARYNGTMRRVSSVKSSFRPMFAVIMSVAVLALASGAGLYYAIVRPLNPPTQKIQVIERVLSLEVLDQIGISKEQILVDENLASDNTNEDMHAAEEGDQEQEEEESSGSERPQADHYGSSGSEMPAPAFELLKEHHYLLISLIVLILMGIITIITRFLLRHQLWLKRIQKLERDEQVDQIYHHLRERLPVLSVSSPGGDTPNRYAYRIRHQTRILDAPGASWRQLSNTFSKLCYGQKPVSDREYKYYIQYFRTFWKGARKMCGVRFLWKQFRL